MEAKQIIRGVVCVGSTRMSGAIARRRGGESTTLGSEGKHQAGYAKAKNAVEAYTLLPQRCMSEERRIGE